MRDGAIETAMLSSFAALLLLIGLLAGLSLVLRRSSRIQSGGPQLSVIETLPLGQGRGMSLVRAGKRFFLVGVTNHGISLVSEMSDHELGEAESWKQPRPSALPFKMWLTRLRAAGELNRGP